MDTLELEQLLKKTLEGINCALYDVAFLKENRTDILRISIKALDRPTSLDVCQEASLLISPLLDVRMPGLKDYTLEVSSMGLERTLSKPRHFALSIGELLECKLVDNTRIRGVLESAQGQEIVLNMEGTPTSLILAQIKKAKTIFEFGKAKNPKKT
ncbi:ribosome maturation factor RimP [Helicobacter heilmannii]|uniref:Ribosome maturation factor RimP n=1 Tax=Helicobacter heilmannii TaxID=35817 RepID=A0A0K2Y7P1_HELHE|nr:ribosome maturation factor RimP [Helicobacter heilmannii]BDQ27780.1 ribosome maturation factor RimP [Helicobacter heilmannii]CCM10936.1 FIG000325: clustered with transcription termination protein NusA [Helicobacter heilmannii ASB1.4]CRI33679.1 FIG000325: clustered with transcription termination protein NusA [Helicobacter heilmannii]